MTQQTNAIERSTAPADDSDLKDLARRLVDAVGPERR